MKKVIAVQCYYIKLFKQKRYHRLLYTYTDKDTVTEQEIFFLLASSYNKINERNKRPFVSCWIGVNLDKQMALSVELNFLLLAFFLTQTENILMHTGAKSNELQISAYIDSYVSHPVLTTTLFSILKY